MNKIHKVAIILPTTLKNASYNELKKLEEFKIDKDLVYGIFMAVDEDDNYDLKKLNSIFTRAKEIVINKFHISNPAQICRMWREVAHEAYNKNYDFFVLLGDDIEIKGKEWVKEIVENFQEISNEKGVPFGIGCVCIKDITSPNFPTFPVIHRKHIDLFKEIFSTDFINQDADPYLYELYRRVGCTKWTKLSYLVNKRGGVTYGLNQENRPIYQQKHIEWRDDILKNSLKELKRNYPKLPDITTIDVVVPCFRINDFFINKIISIDSAKNVDHRFIIVIDQNINNISEDKKNYLRKIENEFPVRVRVNEKNMGASFSRNRGMKESHSDWVLYLDDDVIPNQNIIHSYVQGIMKNPDKDGFVGKSILPRNFKSSTEAAHMSQVSFFWTICDNFPHSAWGVTANLLVRRNDQISFDLDFPKTGGGEDIDFCLKLKNWPLITVKDAIVTHPWWNEGRRFSMWKRFFKWASGDGLLIDKYPHYTFRTLPNACEWTFFLISTTPFRDIKTLKIIPSIWIGEFIAGTLWPYYHRDNCPYLIGKRRVLIAIESNFSRIASDLGHIYCNMSRLKISNLTKRFDWFCGLYQEGIQYELNRSYFHNFFFLLSLFFLWIFS